MREARGGPSPGPLGLTPVPGSTALPSRALGCPPRGWLSTPGGPSVPSVPPAEPPPPPGTCGRFSGRLPPSGWSERPWARAGLRRGRGRPLAAVAAAAPVAAPGRAGRAGRAAPPRPARRLPAPQGRRCPRGGPGVPGQAHSHSEPRRISNTSRHLIGHQEKLRPREGQGFVQDHAAYSTPSRAWPPYR